VGCKDDDDGPETSTVAGNKITATVSASGVVKVKAFIDAGHYDGERSPAIAECDYSNGFTLALPETVDTKYLDPIDAWFLSGNEVSTSDENAKMNELVIAGYNADGNRTGTFYYESKTWDAIFVYADRNVTVTGSYTYSDGDKEIYNISLVKGWNIVYITGSEKNDVVTDTYTTSNPGGMSWVFDNWGDYDSYQAKSAAKSAGSKKRLFRGLK
jgi:hypothetical protein